ncbi:MAG: Mur ligase family protein [Patescibacteria group bacterium]|nr:Mur ligase family protein [Patescibacteria group bacterium]
MIGFLQKINFSLKKPKIIIVTGNGRACAAEAIFQTLKPYLKVKKIFNDVVPLVNDKNEILLFETSLKQRQVCEEFTYLTKKSLLSVLVVTNTGDIPSDKESFDGNEEEMVEIQKIVKELPSNAYVVLNFDDKTIRELGNKTNLNEITFGFQDGVNLQASDVKLNSGTNFKINYDGNIVPIWLRNLFGKEQIYSALSSICCGIIFDLNLVKISQALEKYNSLPGKMKLINGIKKTLILDDSSSATFFSMSEALEILNKIKVSGRKIAVLGDILGDGIDVINIHKAIGEKIVQQNIDLLFLIGARTKFIKEAVCKKGMAETKIFHFDDISSIGLKLQKEIREGDLILINGSKEMKMEKVVEEIKKI